MCLPRRTRSGHKRILFLPKLPLKKVGTIGDFWEGALGWRLPDAADPGGGGPTAGEEGDGSERRCDGR
jgi:hypothetical protein